MPHLTIHQVRGCPERASGCSSLTLLPVPQVTQYFTLYHGIIIVLGTRMAARRHGLGQASSSSISSAVTPLVVPEALEPLHHVIDSPLPSDNCVINVDSVPCRFSQGLPDSSPSGLVRQPLVDFHINSGLRVSIENDTDSLAPDQESLLQRLFSVSAVNTSPGVGRSFPTENISPPLTVTMQSNLGRIPTRLPQLSQFITTRAALLPNLNQQTISTSTHQQQLPSGSSQTVPDILALLRHELPRMICEEFNNQFCNNLPPTASALNNNNLNRNNNINCPSSQPAREQLTFRSFLGLLRSAQSRNVHSVNNVIDSNVVILRMDANVIYGSGLGGGSAPIISGGIQGGILSCRTSVV